jgi:hypothetical protein
MIPSPWPMNTMPTRATSIPVVAAARIPLPHC